MAYTLVVSLQQTLEPLLLDFVPSKFQISTKSQLYLIYKHLRYTKSFFNKVISLEDSNNIEEVEIQIKDVLQSTQDLIESHLSDLFHPGPESSISGFYAELVKVNAKLSSLFIELKAKEDYLTVSGSNKKKVGVVGDVADSSRTGFGRNKQVIVGLNDELLMLKWILAGGSPKLEVVPILGMGGIGKTTLAEQVYLDPLVTQHFDVRLFVEIGVEYNIKEILLRLLGEVDFTGRGEEELGMDLHRFLYDRRYLAVLDDIRGTEAWDRLQIFFPINRNGSRIILTTRNTDIARSDADNIVLKKRILDDEESWKLLKKIALSDLEEVCPPELENVGKTIAKYTGGLPLSILTVGQLLSSSERRVESWMTVAHDIIHPPLSLESSTPQLLNEECDGLDGLGETESGMDFHQFLCGRRYLIVLDDMWDAPPIDSNKSSSFQLRRMVDIARSDAGIRTGFPPIIAW